MTGASWYIDSLALENFRGYSELELTFEHDLTVLIGKNAEGKTSVLDALAVAMGPIMAGFGQTAAGFHLSDVHASANTLNSETAIATLEHIFPVKAEITAHLDGHKLTWTRERKSKNGRTTWGDNGVRNFISGVAEYSTNTSPAGYTLPILAYHGVERLVGIRRGQGAIPPSRLGAYEAALDPKSDLTRLSSYLESLTNKATIDAARTGAVSAAVSAQLDAIDCAVSRALEVAGWRSPTWNPMIRAITLTSVQDGVTLPLSWLSSGVRITAGLVIDLASRMARANPHLGGDDLLRQTPGIVMIDEVDLHLHPQWQKRIISSLRETFPKVQFIVTTHSPQVLSTVPARCIRMLSGDSVKTAEYSEGLRTDIILSSLQETDPEPRTPNRARLEEYLDLVHSDQGTTREALELRSTLDQEMGGVTLVPELAEADAYLAVFGDD